MTPLGAVCEINPKQNRAERFAPNADVSFVPMAAVDERSGRIAAIETKSLGDVSPGHTPFQDNDVLFAKITPCMENGKAAIARQLTNGVGFGSTEFHVLRPKAGLMPEWVFAFIRQPAFRDLARANFTGTAGQQRVPADFLKQVLIPVPPLVEQERIVGILDEAEALRRLRAQTDGRTGSIEAALFQEMFGSPSPDWPRDILGNLGSLDRGRSKHRPRDEPSLFGGQYPFIQTGDVANCSGRITTFHQTYSELGLAQSRLWPAGTLCITIAANIAKTGVLCFDACFPDSVVGFNPGDRVTVEFVQSWLRTLQGRLEEDAPQAAQKNINLKTLRELEVAVPPVDLQRAFTARVAEVRELETAQATSRERLEDLFQSLLHRAFQGEL